MVVVNQTWPEEFKPKGEKPWIVTYRGRRVDPLDLKIQDIDIIDIAHSLSLVNRFGGHTSVPISVAQHSVFVSRLVSLGGSPYGLQGLLHDASEAYLGDVTKWLKETPAYAEYRAAEERVQRVIFERFGCDPVMHQSVRDADWDMVVFEAGIGYGPANWLGESRVVVDDWAPWPWARAQGEFLQMFFMLGGRV